MLIDGRELRNSHILEVDLCIVGAGVAGLTLAREFLGDTITVAVIESGGFERDAETQDLCAGDNVGIPFSSLDEMRLRQVGGTAHLWRHPLGRTDTRRGARVRPLDAIDFESRPEIPDSGWPFGLSHLEPFYRRAEETFQIAPVEWDPACYQRDAGVPPRLLPREDELRSLVFRLAPRDPFAFEFPRLLGDAPNVSLITNATVLEVETDEGARAVASLRIATTAGKEIRARARYFVLGAGGIEIPRLLLLSDRTMSTGLGNQNDLVGRYYMEHPHFDMHSFAPANRGAGRAANYYHRRDWNGERIHPHLALSEEVVRREGLLNHCFELIPDYPRHRRSEEAARSGEEILSALSHGRLPANTAEHLANIMRETGAVAGFLRKRIIRRTVRLFGPPKSFRMRHMTEQAPNRESRITLGTARDRYGQRRTRLDWRLQELDVQSVARVHAIVADRLASAGLGRLVHGASDPLSNGTVQGGYHHMGTTRMHSNPTRGVVDGDCRIHGLHNLFVASSAVFPTGGAANPTLTVGALAIRLADHTRLLLSRPRTEVSAAE